MKWIRIDCTIGDDPALGALADALGVDPMHAVGACVCVFTKLPAHAPTGDIAAVPDATLERWATWAGKRGLFAREFRARLCTEDGIVRDWDRCNGTPIREAELSKARSRSRRESLPEADWLRLRSQVLAEEPLCRRCGEPSEHVDHIQPLRLGGGNERSNLQGLCKRCHGKKTAVNDGGFGNNSPSERQPVRRSRGKKVVANGNGTSDGTNRGTAETTDPAQPERSPQIAVEKSAEKAAERPAPPAAVAEMNLPRPMPDALPPAEPSAVLNRFVAKFYAGAGKDRRADIARQTNAVLNGQGVKRKGNVIRAVDSDHLDQILLEVMEEPPRDPNAAMVFVLDKLNDTYLDVLSARAKSVAGELRERPRAAPPPAGMPGDAPIGATPIRAAIAGVMEGLEFDGDEADVPRETGSGE